MSCLFIELWTLWYQITALGSIHSNCSSIQHENDVIMLEIKHAVCLEVLENPFVYIPEGSNVMVTWYHGFVLSHGHDGTQEQGREVYTLNR